MPRKTKKKTKMSIKKQKEQKILKYTLFAVISFLFFSIALGIFAFELQVTFGGF